MQIKQGWYIIDSGESLAKNNYLSGGETNDKENSLGIYNTNYTDSNAKEDNTNGKTGLTTRTNFNNRFGTSENIIKYPKIIPNVLKEFSIDVSNISNGEDIL